MATNFKQPGNVLTLTAPSGGVVKNVGYQIGNLFVVADATAAEAASFEGHVEGVWTLPRKVADDAWVEGAAVYWDPTPGECTTTGTGNLLIGCAAMSALDNATTGVVRLNGAARPTGVSDIELEDDSVDTAAIQAGALAASADGRAIIAADFFDAATALAKFATDSIANAFLLKAIADGAFVADAATRALFASGFLTKAKAAVFVSTEQTSTGSAQNVAHGLAAVPAAVLIAVTESDGAAFDVAEGSHDSTNVIVTVTAAHKFKVFAWA